MNNARRRLVRLQWGKLSHPWVLSIVSIKDPKPNSSKDNIRLQYEIHPIMVDGLWLLEEKHGLQLWRFKFLHEQWSKQEITYFIQKCILKYSRSPHHILHYTILQCLDNETTINSPISVSENNQCRPHCLSSHGQNNVGQRPWVFP